MIIFIFILINLPIIFTLNPFVWLKVKNKKKRRKKCSSHFPRAMCDVFTLLPLSNQQFKSQSIKRSSTLITLRIKNLEPASVWNFCFMNDWNHLSKQLAIAFLKWCNSEERIVVCLSNSALWVGSQVKATSVGIWRLGDETNNYLSHCLLQLSID